MHALRKKVISTAKFFTGAPHSEMSDIQLIQEVINALRKDFGFLLPTKCSLAECYRALPVKLQPTELQSGDLIFYEGTWNERGASRKKYLVHVEIFLGGETGTASISSLARASHPRTQGRDGVQIYDDYRVASTSEWTQVGLHFRSLASWLGADETSFVHAKSLEE
mmetsp:Transcript_105738/g.299095  ORF Transcript_105738/g.299095 Transcript_105738/m.299095 type:complete len:166 (+) Transcript_105738:2-499(+)